MNIPPRGLAPALLVLTLTGMARADHEVYLRTLPSTVMVVRLAEDSTATGSGVLVDLERRLVVTNYHLVGDSSDVLVVFPSYDTDGKLIAERWAYTDRVSQLGQAGRIVASRVVIRELQRDLALIQLPQVPKDAKALRLAAEAFQSQVLNHASWLAAGESFQSMICYAKQS